MTDPRPGSELAGHRVEGVIGRGGMSVVYLAEHIGLRRKVALKVLGPELADDEAFRERFIRESQITARLDHPNIVTVYDAGEADGVLYISMRYVEGTDLERLLRADTRLESDRAVSLISQAAAALDAAHAAGLVHRDVKPGNILLASDARSSSDRAFLSDFGVTKRLETGAGITRTGQFVGTVDYVSPEQIRGEDLDGRADVYSLGCVLYRCLTGEVPFPRDTEVATIYAHLQDPPPVPSGDAPSPGGFDVRSLAPSPRRVRTGSRRAAFAVPREVVRPRRPPATVVAPVAEPRPTTTRRRVGLVVAGLAVAAISAARSCLASDGDDAARRARHRNRLGLPTVPTLAWTPVVERPAFVGPGDQAIAGASDIDGTIVAVGLDDAGDDTDAAAWTSPDGAHWTRAGAPGRIGDQRMRSVANTGRGCAVAYASTASWNGSSPIRRSRPT
jgi:serine/threonine-protein kinase